MSTTLKVPTHAQFQPSIFAAAGKPSTSAHAREFLNHGNFENRLPAIQTPCSVAQQPKFQPFLKVGYRVPKGAGYARIQGTQKFNK